MKLNRLDGPYCNFSVYCDDCKHLTAYKGEVPCCKAYPGGIPPAVWQSYDEHEPVNGYVFEEEERDSALKLGDFEIIEDDL